MNPDDKKWGDWIPWCKRKKPLGLSDCRIQAVYINFYGELLSDTGDNRDRHTESHIWFSDKYPKAITLTYRKEVAE
jgi:hypothetical protein